MELCLGTDPFVTDFSLRDSKKVSKADLFTTLDYARSQKIGLLDTTDGYDDSLKAPGKYMIQNPRSFEIISKLPMDLFKNLTSYRDYRIKSELATEELLRKLWIPHFKGLLFQNPDYLYDKNAVSALRQLKKSGYTDWIGAVVYKPQAAVIALELGLDVIQLPIHLFDHRFDQFINLANGQIRIFARNIFNNNQISMDMHEIYNRYPTAAPVMERLNELCQNYGLTRCDISIAYLKSMKGISGIILDVDRIDRLKEKIASYHRTPSEETVDAIIHQLDLVRNE